YPQSDVTAAKGAELSSYVQTKPSNGNNNGWTSYNYYMVSSNDTDFMWYKDVDVDNNGTKDYRAVYFTSYRPWKTGRTGTSIDSNQDDNGYYTGNVYWFKFEPIKWRILSEKNNTAIILAELVLDNQDYNYSGSTRTINNQTVQANNYEYSSIRAWLNDNFYNTAFNEYEKTIINTIEVDNSARSTNPDNDATYWNYGANSYACNNTYDKVWLLSLQEVTTAEYGFAESPTAYDTLRQKKTSAYAQCQGAYTHNYGGDYDGNGSWALRSPHYSYQYVNQSKSVQDDGSAKGGGDADYLNGVVPALQISLSADEIVGTYEVYSWAIGDETVYAGQEYNGETFNAEDLIFNVNKDGTCRFVHMGILSYEGTWEKIANGEYRCIVRHVDAEDWFITDNFTLEHGKITFGEFFADYVFIKQN
nr:hypothetical protein [Clostridia bacterium]